MRARAAAWIATLGCAALGLNHGSAEAQTWKRYTYPPDQFSVEFPEDRQVQAAPIQVSPETQRAIDRSVQYTYDAGNTAYIVGLTVNKTDVRFDDGVNASFGGLKCATKMVDKPLTIANGRGRELRGNDCVDGLRAEARYYVEGKNFYQVLAVYPKDGGDEPGARRFVESFQLIANRPPANPAKGQ